MTLGVTVTVHIPRREFIVMLGSATTRPLVARAQQRTGRVGVLTDLAAHDPEGQSRLAAFLQALQQVGWSDGGNIRIDARWSAGDTDRLRKNAAELVALAPDVILASGTPAVRALQQVTRTVPVVFVGVIDPVGSGLVASLARPAGNATGFIGFEYALAAKWLQLLKEIAPRVTRAAVLRDPTIAAGIGQFAAIQTVGSVGMELTAIDLRDADEIERAVASFASGLNGGLIVTASWFGANHPDVIVASAARHKVPAVYPHRYFVTAGGLICYGPDVLDEYRRAAGYVDRILKGDRPADLPVQAPIKYGLVVNLNTAKALGLDPPASLLERADEVIE
jgi:putative tryptophan/tyrosine transport system substrate-binding protein